MVQRERLCIYCFKPFSAKSLKARYCCPAHRIEYFRRRKRQENHRIKMTRKALLLRGISHETIDDLAEFNLFNEIVQSMP